MGQQAEDIQGNGQAGDSSMEGSTDNKIHIGAETEPFIISTDFFRQLFPEKNCGACERTGKKSASSSEHMGYANGWVIFKRHRLGKPDNILSVTPQRGCSNQNDLRILPEIIHLGLESIRKADVIRIHICQKSPPGLLDGPVSCGIATKIVLLNQPQP